MPEKKQTLLSAGSEPTETPPFEPSWVHKDQIAGITPLPGVLMQSVVGQKLMANWVTIDPNSLVPRHHHHHEQLGIMLEGALELTLGEETRLLGPGDAYTIPPHLPHSARTLDQGCVLLDIFTPPRDDYNR